jgi:hypothetical protein
MFQEINGLLWDCIATWESGKDPHCEGNSPDYCACFQCPYNTEQYVGQPYRRLAVRKLVRERDNERSLRWFLAAGVAVVVLLIMFLPGCKTAPVPTYEEALAAARNKAYWERSVEDWKLIQSARSTEPKEDSGQSYAERQSQALYNGNARLVQKEEPVTPERVTQAEPAWKTRLREYQQAIGEPYAPYEEYEATIPVDRSDRVLSIPKIEPRDVNNDGKVTCIDYAIAFYLKWGERYGFEGISLTYNADPDLTHGAHLFVTVHGKPWDYARQAYLQEGKRYGPDKYTHTYWVYRSRNNEVVTFDDPRWKEWGRYDGKGY